MVDYSPLWKTMEKKGISQYYLIKKGGIDNKTIYNIKRNENRKTLHFGAIKRCAGLRTFLFL